MTVPLSRHHHPLHEFDMDSIVIDEYLGSGSFASVYSFHLKSTHCRRRRCHDNHHNPSLKHSCSSGTLGGSDSSSTAALTEEATEEPATTGTTTGVCPQQQQQQQQQQQADSSSCCGLKKQQRNQNQSPETSPLSLSSLDSHGLLALKTLHKKTLQCPHKFQSAARDLLNEVRVLSHLPRHAHIVTLYGTSQGFINHENDNALWQQESSSSSSSSSSFLLQPNAFIVLERLGESLDAVLHRWKLEATANSTVLSSLATATGLRRRRQHSTRAAQAQRLHQCGLGVARAMEFLHSRQIMYRDLKPANLGLTVPGGAGAGIAVVKMFDFALAVHLPVGSYLCDRVGTLRYMAPEVASRCPYHYSADVFSFGMVLYEILTLSKPYKHATDKPALEYMVSDETGMPCLNKIASSEIRSLLRDCWNYDIDARPDFGQIVQRLQTEVSLWQFQQQQQQQPPPQQT